MKSLKSDQHTEKLPYVCPELVEKGSVAELTQQTKDLGATDGLVHVTLGPLADVS